MMIYKLQYLSLWATVATSVLAKQPNILFIITDDQDGHMESIEHMPLLKKHILDEGTTYENHFCTVALCCPSRVNLWTGRAAHNTNVTNVGPPYGGYPKVVQEGINDDYLPIWMQAQGYNTYYTGKLWNAHTINNYNEPYVRGYNGSEFLLDPFTYDYWHARMSRNGEAPRDYSGQYSPDVVAEKAHGFLEEAIEHDAPFFVTVAPIAPHSNILGNPPSGALDPLSMSSSGPPNKFAIPEYHPRHAHLFKDYKIPRTENFNPEKANGASWIKNLPRLNDTVISYNDEFQRARLRALQSVDEMIEDLINLLEVKGVLDETYVFFTTDNGFHISQYRMHPGKECGYDTDVHIPLAVRGPGIARGAKQNIVTSHTDLAPTLLSLAGSTRPDFDGLAIPLLDNATSTSRGEHVNVEFWGIGLPEGLYGTDDDGTPGLNNRYPNNTYKALRLIGESYSLYYSVWCTGEREFYDLTKDPGQMRNYFEQKTLVEEYKILGRPWKELIYRLDALLVVLKTCKGRQCVEPWKEHHSSGEVHTLEDALQQRFDAYYAAHPKVGFSSCELGYLKDAEGNHKAISHAGVAWEGYGYGDQQTFQYTGSWSEWT